MFGLTCALLSEVESSWGSQSVRAHVTIDKSRGAANLFLGKTKTLLSLIIHFLSLNLSIKYAKMLGQKIGTGGSSGQGYLKQTVDKHKLFTDLANIATLMISRSYLPELPINIKETLGFNYKK